MDPKLLYEWAKEQFGDDADSMSNDQIREAYNKVNPPEVAPNAIQNQATLNPNDGNIDDYTKEMDDWWNNEQRHPDDTALYNTLTPGEKAWLKSLPNSPGLQERLQFIRSTPEDRAKIMGQMNEADQEVAKEGGPAPFTEAVLNDTQTSATEQENIENKDVPNTETNTNVDWNSVPSANASVPSIDTKGRYKVKSIWDAYNDGDIDKSTRDYMLVDAMSKGLRGIGKDIGNVGAAFTGGTVQDSTPDESLWNKRNEEMTKSAIESEKAGVSGSREQRVYDEWAANQMMRQYNNMSARERLNMAAIVEKYAKNAPNDTIRLKYMDIANKMLSGNTLSDKDLAISGIGELWSWLSKSL